jgi:clan AA aspartic protease
MVVRRRGTIVGFIHMPVSVKTPGGSARYDALFLVDTGAIDSMAPASELERVGIQPAGRQMYELADGRLEEYAFGVAQIEFMGAITGGRVIFGPEGVEPFLGVTALEAGGITIDPATQTLRKLPAVRL